jgi:hypothetical protein
VAYATVLGDGTIVAARSQGISQDDVDVDTVAGAVCFTGLPFTVRSAVVSADHWSFDGGQADVVASVFVAAINASGSLGDCQGRSSSAPTT